MLKKIFIMVIVSMSFSGTAMAGNCQKLWPYVNDARGEVIRSFIDYDMDRLEAGIEEMVFWDSYIQIECNKGSLTETPVHWLSRERKQELSPYTAGFLFWMQYVKKEYDIDLTPAGLVSGRSFEQ